MKIRDMIPFMGLFFACTVAACGGQAGFTGDSGQKVKRSKPVAGKDGGKHDSGSGSDDKSGDPGMLETDEGAGPYAAEATFDAAQRKLAEIDVKPESGIGEQKITLTSLSEHATKTYQQIVRPAITDLATQGNPGTSKTEQFGQVNQGILDLVVVIDNSGSMSQEQKNLSTKLAPLLSYIKDSDWRIGVVTTDPKDPCMRALISKGDADIDTKFAAAVMAGTSGTGNEQGIKQAVTALSCPTAPWVRDLSTVAVLIVSDEDNCSNNGSGCQAPYNSEKHLLDHLNVNMKRVIGTDARVYGLFWHPDHACSGAANKGTQYAKAVSQTGGAWGSICDADYTTTLARISQDVSTILKSDFPLAAMPDAGSVVVKVDGTKVGTGFEVIGKTLRFTTPPAKGAQIDVTYTVGATLMRKEFSLSEIPIPQGLKVLENGIEVAPEKYTLDAAGKLVSFKSFPAADANLRFEYVQDLPLQTEFATDLPIRVGTLKAWVNDLETANYQLGDGKVVFDMTPGDGDSVRLEYERITGPVLEYEVARIGANPTNYQVLDASTSVAVNAAIVDGVMTIAESEHADGRILLVQNTHDDTGKLSVNLPQAPIEGTFRIEAGNLRCKVGENVTINGLVAHLNCGFTTTDPVQIRFEYYTEPMTDYSLDHQGDPEAGVWTVLVDGILVPDWSRSGSTIILAKPPGPTAKVTVRFAAEQ